MNNVEKIISAMKSNIAVDDSYKGITAGTEGLDPVMADMITSKRSMVTSGVESAFAQLSIKNEDGISDFEISPIQVEAAKAVAIYGTDPLETMKRFSQGRDSAIAPGTEATVIDTSALVSGTLSNSEIRAGIEAFDGQVVGSSLYATVAFNTLSIVQDQVVELFYPVIVMDPSKDGIVGIAKITNIMSAIKRNNSGAPTDFKKESIIKKLNDTALFTLDANRLYPVKAARTEANLLTPAGVDGLTRVVTVGDGVNIETAPLLPAKTIDVLAISQTDELLATGYMDETDALTSSVNVENLYFKVTGKDADGNDVTEYHTKVISGLPATFTGTLTGENKDIGLNYATNGIAWTGGNILTASGGLTKIADLANLPAGYVAKLKLNLKGDGHVQEGTVAIYAVVLELDSVLDGNGNELPEDNTTYIAVKAIFDNIEFAGYDLEAYATNSNARFRGKMLTTDTYRYVYTVPVRTKLREVVSAFNNGSDGDTAGILAQIDFTKRALGKYGMLELNNTAAVLETLSADTEDYGISTKLVNKYSNQDTIDLSTIVNTLTSTDRESDIMAALKLRLRNEAITMLVESGYGITFESLFPGSKPTVIIGTDTNIGRFISNFSDDHFNYVVKVSNDNLITGKLFMSFGIMGAARNKEINYLNFGNCLWSPEVVISLQRQENGRVAHETITMPRFKHHTFLPILSTFNITGVDAVSGKQVFVTQTV